MLSQNIKISKLSSTSNEQNQNRGQHLIHLSRVNKANSSLRNLLWQKTIAEKNYQHAFMILISLRGSR